MSNDPEKADPLVRLLGAFGAALKQIEDDVQTMVAPFQKLCRQLVDLSAAFQRAGESLPNAILAAMFAKIEDETPPGPLRNLTMTAARLVLSEHEHDRKIGLAILSWIGDDAPRPLEAYLGLRHRGTGGSPSRALALHRRDRILRRMRLKYWPDFTPGEVAREMIASYEYYHERQWPRDRDAAVAPAEWPEHVWWHLLWNEYPLPKDRRLRQILDRPD